LADRLRRGIRRIESAPRAGARTLPILRGVTPTGLFTRGQENALADARDILVASQRLFNHGNGIVLLVGEGACGRLCTIANDNHTEPGAVPLLANIFVCELPPIKPDDVPIQFPPSKSLCELVLNNEPTRRALPCIQVYATRPVFGSDFAFYGPGWHADQGILVHCEEIEPSLPPLASAEMPAIGRLPPGLRALLAGFCFRSDADLVNAVGAFLTGLLANHFLTTSKALVLMDGNQPGVGKTLLARAIGLVLDGAEPDVIHYTSDDEELAKRICATLKARSQTLVIDNAKVRANTAISSPVLESNSMAAQISLRILGQSTNMTRPNDLLWVITMNDTKTSPDLVSRGLPIRLYFEGNPGEREFPGGNPLTYAATHRAELLGELAGMIARWTQAGRPRSGHRHRCAAWAGIIGGILQANGLPEFLANLNEAAGDFNADLDDLASLAEAALATHGSAAVVEPGEGGEAGERGLTASRWEAIFRSASVLTDELGPGRSQRSKETRIGDYLARNLGRSVGVRISGGNGTATLRRREGRARRKLYYFEVVQTEPDDQEGASEPAGEEGGPDRVTVTTRVAPKIDLSLCSQLRLGNDEDW
jgi:hypothetical protein